MYKELGRRLNTYKSKVFDEEVRTHDLEEAYPAPLQTESWEEGPDSQHTLASQSSQLFQALKHFP